jgi:hypothetical protein
MPDNIVQLNTELIHSELKDLVKNSVEETLNALLDAEADRLVNAERYARDEERQGYRAGHYDRSFTTTAGEVICSKKLIVCWKNKSLFSVMSCFTGELRERPE